MENEDELAEGVNNTQYRKLDSRIGRWLSIDPLASSFPNQSPYNFGFNNPVFYTDKSGAAPEGKFCGPCAVPLAVAAAEIAEAVIVAYRAYKVAQVVHLAVTTMDGGIWTINMPPITVTPGGFQAPPFISTIPGYQRPAWMAPPEGMQGAGEAEIGVAVTPPSGVLLNPQVSTEFPGAPTNIKEEAIMKIKNLDELDDLYSDVIKEEKEAWAGVIVADKEMRRAERLLAGAKRKDRAPSLIAQYQQERNDAVLEYNNSVLKHREIVSSGKYSWYTKFKTMLLKRPKK